MTDKEILADVPEGATHYSKGTYYKATEHIWTEEYCTSKDAWFVLDDGMRDTFGMRCINDIKRIVELEGYDG